MTRHFFVVALLAASLAACGSTDPKPMTVAAADTAPANAATAVAATDDDDPNKEICRTEPIVGSKFVRRVCATRAQWEDIERNTQQQMDMMRQSVGGQSACSGNNCR